MVSNSQIHPKREFRTERVEKDLRKLQHLTAHLLYLAFMLIEGPPVAQDLTFASKAKKPFPTLRMILHHYQFENEHTIYAVYPKRKCHCTYKSIAVHRSSVPVPLRV